VFWGGKLLLEEVDRGGTPGRGKTPHLNSLFYKEENGGKGNRGKNYTLTGG